MKTWNERLSQALAESEEYQGNVNRFAGDIGVSAPSVAAWIGAGTITPAKDIKAVYLIKACSLLHTRPEWILFGSGQKYATESPNNVGVNPEANVTDPNSDKGNPGIIKRLQDVLTEVQEILSLMQGLPAETIAAKPSHDMNISSVRRDAEATRKLVEELRQGEGQEHGQRRNEQQPSAGGRKNRGL